MQQYLALLFTTEFSNQPILKEWQTREGQTVEVGSPLFIYGEGSGHKTFNSPVSGTFKAFLLKEGEALIPNNMVAVVQVDAKTAEDCETSSEGKVLSPEEAKGGMSYAEAASIRLPSNNMK